MPMLRIRAIPLRRRFALASISLVLCALLFHGRIAEALVTRGDSFLEAGKAERAERYYRRALFWDPASTVAADRFAFTGFQLRTRGALDAAIAVAGAALSRSPSDRRLLLDRALCLQAQRRFNEARADFARAAEIGRDPQLLHFAGRAALRSGDRRAARRYWREALQIDPSFEPSALALRDVRP
jgi:tetratricopeptide (TPR) repeat protein